MAQEKAMGRQGRIDRAVYLADDRSRTYRFLRRNPGGGALTCRKTSATKGA